MKQDKIGGLVSIAIGAGSLAETAILYPYRLNSISGDFVMPGVVGVLLVVLGLLLVFVVKTPPYEIERADRRGRLQMLGTVVILFAYWYAISELGYVIGTLLASLGLFKVVSGYGWIRATVYAGIVTLVLYVVLIQLLNIALPTGIFNV
jgi:putative tricarboxylic transport membrane protein